MRLYAHAKPTTVNLAAIISGNSGKRETFEELVCQIARRSPPVPNAEYRRIHGAGGDGGVEAVWILPNGEKHGYQAKFYLESGGVDWSSIDNSVLTALQTHPMLSKMVIAIACNLTGELAKRPGKGRPPIPGWSHWDTHRSKWENAAIASGRSVTFEAWTASDIDGLLNRPCMLGLREYWFGTIDLSPQWLEKQFNRTVAALDERYQPEDHVDVATSDVFDGLRRSDVLRDRLRSASLSVLEASRFSHISTSQSEAINCVLQKLKLAVNVLRESRADLTPPVWVSFPSTRWTTLCSDLDDLSAEIRDRLERDQRQSKIDREAQPKAESAPRTRIFEDALRELRSFRSSVDGLSDLLNSRSQQADNLRFAIVVGRAGAGKSHLLASEIRKAISNGSPCIFLLGTDFVEAGQIEPQIVRRLELRVADLDMFLAAMEAAAEASSTRGLVVIDAVNESASPTLWRGRLKGFADRVLAHPHLALCVSCRTEYEPHVLTSRVREIALKVTVRGFETATEQEEAARVYMDRRGITRPAVPWLNPEFVNPLFLRTTCLALQKERRREFPRGLRGTQELLKFFLDTAARHLGTTYDGTNDLQPAVVNAVLSLAHEMAREKRNYVERAVAVSLVNKAFEAFTTPTGVLWVELLRSKGLLRFDPHPEIDRSNPLKILSNVVAFSFQRFQDHLIIQSLLSDITSPERLFEQDSPLNFLLDRNAVAWEWHGAFGALFIQAADKFRIELPDHLPNGIDHWWARWEIQEAFIESVRWRSTGAFTDRTRVLLNSLDQPIHDTAKLLIELSVVRSHPWNANFLHSTLISRPLAQRDSFWTAAINDASRDEGHPANRLIDWSLNVGVKTAEVETLSLTLLSLGWLTTSTSAQVRDRATKAMCAVLVERPDLFMPVFSSFRGCNDPYVVERLVAAAYGASCRDPTPERLRLFSRVVYAEIFNAEHVVPAFLLRDYARGIIDLAAKFSVLDTDIDPSKCRPPYRSVTPMMTRKDIELRALATSVGAESILRSCYDGLADFGRYIVEGRVDRFADASLSGPRPLTVGELFDGFRQEFVASFPEREAALGALVDAIARVRWHVGSGPSYFSFSTDPDDEAQVTVAEERLLVLLDPSGCARYNTDARPHLKKSHSWSVPGRLNASSIDVEAAKRWIANRAILFGWTKELFPSDRSGGDGRSQESKIERIGKKYQRIALSELLARLSDNYWLVPEYGEPSRWYDTPLDVSFTRDIDPTVLPTDLDKSPRSSSRLSVPKLVVRETTTEMLQNWVYEPGTAATKLALATGSDLEGENWQTLYRFAGCDIKFDEETSWGAPWKQSEFHFLYLLMMTVDERDRLVSDAPVRKLDFHLWLPRDEVDASYLGELGLRSTWPFDGPADAQVRVFDDLAYRTTPPVVGYHWESQRDGSLPDGLSLKLPAPWVLESLALKSAPERPGEYVDTEGCSAIAAGQADRNSFSLIRRDLLDRLVDTSGLRPVWALIGERQAWPRQSDEHSWCARRFNGLCWIDGARVQTATWVEDTKGSSAT